MIGRKVGAPIGQRIGQTIGNNVRGANDVAEQALAAARQVAAKVPGGAGEILEMKLNPVSHLDAAAQYGNMIGRNRGDDLAQLAVALAAPGIFGEKKMLNRVGCPCMWQATKSEPLMMHTHKSLLITLVDLILIRAVLHRRCK